MMEGWSWALDMEVGSIPWPGLVKGQVPEGAYKHGGRRFFFTDGFDNGE
jgi:hypothetical protein